MKEITLEDVKRLYEFSVIEIFAGEEVVSRSKCTQWARRKETKNDKDLVYIRLRARFRGEKTSSILYVQFNLEDSEGYFSSAMPPEDYLEKVLSSGQEAEGGILFSLYRDISPARLWFDTGMRYSNSSDPILIDIALPLPEASTRTQVLAQDELAQTYTQQIALDLEKASGFSIRQTEKFIHELSKQCGIPYRKLDYGYVLRVLLEGGRKQNVILNFSGKDSANNDLLTIGTICAQARSSVHDRTFLRVNPKMAYGAIGVTSIRGKDHYVICQTYPVSLLNREIMTYAIQNIASKGDWLEKKLTRGLDIQ